MGRFSVLVYLVRLIGWVLFAIFIAAFLRLLLWAVRPLRRRRFEGSDASRRVRTPPSREGVGGRAEPEAGRKPSFEVRQDQVVDVEFDELEDRPR